jgi:predicted nucleotidyltransferase
MNSHIYSFEEIKEKLCPIFTEHGVKKAVLFGSYSKGCAAEESDVDIYVESELHGFKFLELIEDIKEALDKDVDVYDIRHIDEGTYIESEIKKDGVLLYEK